MGLKMQYLSKFVLAIGLMTLAACGAASGPVNDRVSGWALDDVSVRYGPEISRTASGQEFNSNFVWEGDGEGNRKRLVLTMFRSAMAEVGAEAMTGPQPVKMKVQINKFHALTNFSRLFCCGEHNIRADLTIEDADSGEVLAEGKDVYLGRVALGGVPGLVAVAAGRDQRVRIEEGIVKRTREWLAGL